MAPAQPAAPPANVVSPDGAWLWTGSEWIPASPAPSSAPPPAVVPSEALERPAGTVGRRRGGRGRVRLLLAGVVAVTAIGAGALTLTGSDSNTSASGTGTLPKSNEPSRSSQGKSLSNGWRAGGSFDIEKAIAACDLSPRSELQAISGSPELIRAELSPTGERLTRTVGMLAALVPETDGTFGVVHITDDPLAYRCPDFTLNNKELVADFCDYLPSDLAPYVPNPDTRWNSVIDDADLGFDYPQGDYGDGEAPLIYDDAMSRPRIYCGYRRSEAEQAPN